MFRKIHSNRDPNDTLVREIRKEFSSYFSAAREVSERILEKRPLVTFGVMVALLAASLIVSLVFFRYSSKPKPVVVSAKVSPMGDGFSEIIHAGEKLKTTLTLKNIVDSLSAKKSLTARDSAALNSALDRLQAIQKSLK